MSKFSLHNKSFSEIEKNTFKLVTTPRDLSQKHLKCHLLKILVFFFFKESVPTIHGKWVTEERFVYTYMLNFHVLYVF